MRVLVLGDQVVVKLRITSDLISTALSSIRWGLFCPRLRCGK